MTNVPISNTVHFEKLFKAFYGKLIFFANRYVNDLEIAEERVSEVFAKLWEQRESHQFKDCSPAFLFTMVKNNCISFLRHQKGRE